MEDTNIVEVPAPVESTKVKPTKATTKAIKPATGKNITPKELALQLKIDPKKLRRYLREAYGTHHKAWEITPAMAKAMHAKLGKSSK